MIVHALSLHILTQWLSTHVGDNISKSAFVDVIDFEDILLRIGSWSFGWNQLKRIFIPVIIQHSQKLFFNGSSRITQSVANDSPVGDSSIMSLRLLFSLPFGLEVLRLLQLVLANLEGLNLHAELVSSVLVFNLFEPLSGLVIPLLFIVLFTLFLNDDSIHVSKSQCTMLKLPFPVNLLMEHINVSRAVSFDVLLATEVSQVNPKYLTFLNDAAKIAVFFW